MVLGPLMLDVTATTLSAEERDLLQHPLVGGVILFARNYESRTQLAELTRAIHELRTPQLLIAVDHEGGRVQRFRHEFTALPPLARLGDIYRQDEQRAVHAATELGWLMAAELRATGVDFSFAPVLDLYSRHSLVINDRAFDADPEVVGRLAQAYVRGMHAAGMSAVGKHFPGHGTVVADSHHELPVDPRSFYDISTKDLVPFRLLAQAGIEGVMPAHILFPEVDSVPVGYSKVWLDDILRQNLGFQGTIFSDDLSMAGALGVGTAVERARRALGAGCDMILICNDRKSVEGVVAGFKPVRSPLTQVRLMRMHGRKSSLSEQELCHDERWRAATEFVARFEDAPSLGLGDDSPA